MRRRSKGRRSLSGRRTANEGELSLCKSSESDDVSLIGSTMSSQSRSSSIHSLTAHSGSSASSVRSSLGPRSLLPLLWADIGDASRKMLANIVVEKRMMNKRYMSLPPTV